MLFGLAPLAPLIVSGISESLKDTAGSTTGSAGAQFFRRALVAGELAVAKVLLMGCGLMLRAFWKLQGAHRASSRQCNYDARIAAERNVHRRQRSQIFGRAWTHG